MKQCPCIYCIESNLIFRRNSIRRYRQNPKRRYNPRKLRFSHEEIVNALTKSRGSRSEAAKILGVSLGVITRAIKLYDLSEQFPVQLGSRPLFTREEIISALQDSSGNREVARKKLGLSRAGMSKYIKKFNLYKVVPPGPRAKSKITKRVIIDALDKTGGSRKKAAQLLNVDYTWLLELTSRYKLQDYKKERIPIEEARPLLRQIKEDLGVSISRFAELLGIKKHKLRSYLQPKASYTRGGKTYYIQAVPKIVVDNAVQLLSLSSAEPLHLGMVYSSGDKLFLAIDDNKVLAFEDQPEVRVVRLGVTSNLVPENELTILDLIDTWGISQAKLDRLAEIYFPRPEKNLKHKPRKDFTKPEFGLLIRKTSFY